jgi:hypothetical protein
LPIAPQDWDPAEAIRPHLLPGEHVLWTGRPNPLRLLNANDAFMVPFSVLWASLTTPWALGALVNGELSVSLLWALPFALLGQYMLWGRFVAKWWGRRRTVYAVTDRRILSARGGYLESLPMGQLPATSYSTRRDGSGTITFGSPSGASRQLEDSGMEWLSRRSAPGVLAFRDIPDVERVHLLVYQQAGTMGSR